MPLNNSHSNDQYHEENPDALTPEPIGGAQEKNNLSIDDAWKILCENNNDILSKLNEAGFTINQQANSLPPPTLSLNKGLSASPRLASQDITGKLFWNNEKAFEPYIKLLINAGFQHNDLRPDITAIV